jgi:photosystem II stability/assembly factor-like uncharacterized protein
VVLSASFAGLFRTADGGATWDKVGPADESYLSLSSAGDGALLAGTFSRGVLRSTDGGATWLPPPASPSVGGQVYSLAEGGDGSLFAGTSGGLARSRDGGDTWQVILPLTYVNALWTEGALVLAGSRFGGAFRSDDGGESWTSLDGHFPPLPGAFIDHFGSDGRGGFLGVIDSAVYRSTDGGRTWARLGWELTDRISDLAALPGGTLYLAAEDGVWASDDGGETRRVVGYRPVPIGVVAELEDGFMAGASGLSLSGALYWRDASTERWRPGGWFRDVAPRDIVTLGGEDLLLGLTSLEEPALGGVYRSADAGRTWQLGGLHSRGVFSLALDETGKVYAGTGPGQFSATDPVVGGVHRSADGGRSWTDVSANLARSSPAMEVRQVVVAAGGFVYARTDDAGGSPSLQRFDGSGRWVDITPAAVADRLRALAVDSKGAIFVGSRDGRIVRSEDRGKVWSETEPIPGRHAVTAMEVWNATLWAGTEAGLYRSADEGATWTLETEIPSDASITVLETWASGSTLFAGTESHGVFRIERATVVSGRSRATRPRVSRERTDLPGHSLRLSHRASARWIDSLSRELLPARQAAGLRVARSRRKPSQTPATPTRGDVTRPGK